MVAKTAQNRVIGRWVSDCPLSTVKSCLLWITSNPPQTKAWEIYETEDSLGFENVMNEVPNPTSQYAAPPRDLALLLAKNLPGSKPVAQIAAQPVPRQFAESAPQFQPQPQLQAPPVQAPPVQAAPPQAAPVQAAPVQAAPVQARVDEEREEKREVAYFLRNAMRELKRGADPADIREALFAFGTPEDMLYADDEDLDEWNDPQGEVYTEEWDHVGQPGAQVASPEQLEIDQALSATLGPLPPGVRPLGPNEVPVNMSEEERAAYDQVVGDDEGIREKLRATHMRSMNAVAHAERVAAMRNREREVLAAQAAEESNTPPSNGNAAPETNHGLALEDNLDLDLALLDDMVTAPIRTENGGGAPVDVGSVVSTIATKPKPKRRRKTKRA